MMTSSDRSLPEYRSALAPFILNFVLEKRATGCRYDKTEQMLKRFDRFCAEHGLGSDGLTKETAMLWAEKRNRESDDAHSRRIRLVRMLAEYMLRLGYPAWSLPKGFVKYRESVYQPHIFTEGELARFFKRADACAPDVNSTIRHKVLPLLFRMIYGCGLRISEPLRLTVGDVDTTKGVLTLLETKFGKERLVPMASSLNKRCREYMSGMHAASPSGAVFFPSPTGGRYSERTIYEYFRRFLREAGISHGGRGKGPRIHDLRHTFAVHCLKRWVRAGVHTAVTLPYLSAYLGHAGLKNSQRYLRLTADLHPDISSRMDEMYGALIPSPETTTRNTP